jgi:E3 ubiquitin-protein ligase RNF115/126
LIQSDPNKYGTPPASKSEVEKLQKEIVHEDNLEKYKDCECAVCKEAYSKLEKTIKMPCNHLFHEDCIIPWLKQHNSCPVCRYELKTDDQYYESKKAQNKTNH